LRAFAQESLGQIGAGVDQMLAVVQHKEHVTICEVLHKGVRDGLTSAATAPERRRYGVWHQVRSVDRCQIHEPHPIAESVDEGGGDAERQLRLAAPAGPSQRDQAAGCLHEQRTQRGSVVVTSDE
jgi:hypothetical protein